jgi:hypothetical protein
MPEEIRREGVVGLSRITKRNGMGLWAWVQISGEALQISAKTLQMLQKNCNSFSATQLAHALRIYVHSPLYEGMSDFSFSVWHCFVASLGYGLLILLIFGAGWAALRRSDWFVNPARSNASAAPDPTALLRGDPRLRARSDTEIE